MLLIHTIYWDPGQEMQEDLTMLSVYHKRGGLCKDSMFTIFPHSQGSGWVWFSGGLCDHKPGCIRIFVECHSPQY